VKPRETKLFSAIVVAGAALTAASCRSQQTSSEERVIAPSVGDRAAAEVVEASVGAAAEAADVIVAEGTDSALDAAARDSSAPRCPPGSERPVPPCYHIR